MDKNYIVKFAVESDLEGKMQTQVSQELLKVLSYAVEEAMRTGDLSIGTDHLLLGLLRHRDNDACRALEALGVDLADFKLSVESAIFRPDSIAFGHKDEVIFSRSARNTINLCIVEASIAESAKIIPVHLLLAISASASSASLSYLKAVGLDHSRIRAYLKENDLLKARIVKIKGSPEKNHPLNILTIMSSPDKICS